MLSVLGRRSAMSGAQRDRLLGTATRLHREMLDDTEVVATLEGEGAPGDLAREVNAEARVRVDRELAASVRLPASSKREINYYFLLGLTPEAGPDDVRRAFRRKAMEVHPDRHQREFVADQWADLMTVVADASDVLGDPRKRRAYDVFWRDRSRTVAMRYRRAGEKRGDLETRYLWEIAEMAEIEERLNTLLGELRRGIDAGTDLAHLTTSLCHALEEYEGRMIEIRTSASAFPEHLLHFSDRVKAEMQRKERLVRALQQLLPRAPSEVNGTDRARMAGRLDAVSEVLAEIRHAQNLFELGTARPFI